MLSPELVDNFRYRAYFLRHYRGNRGPPLIRTTSRLISAVVNNHVDVLRDLLDSPKWYNVLDRERLNLLEIAFCANRRKAFKYLISLPGFVDHCGKRTLTRIFNTHNIDDEEYFAHELILKGVDVDMEGSRRPSALHAAVDRRFATVAKLLMERGMNVHELDREGRTLLETLIGSPDLKNNFEIAAALLAYGAQSSFAIFQRSLIRKHPVEVQEMLFLHTFDSFLRCEVELEIILKLALSESWMFDQIVEYPLEICVNRWGNTAFSYFYLLCSMKMERLRKVVGRFGSVLSEVFRVTDDLTHSLPFDFAVTIRDENLDFLLHNVVPVDFLVKMEPFELFDRLIRGGYNENRITELYCFFLSYGAVVDERDLQLVYKHFGFGELFKILLHMDHQACNNENGELIPRIIYDPTISVERLLERPKDNYWYIMGSGHELLHYFADPRLMVESYFDLEGVCCAMKKENLPKLPRLVELARNKFREDLVRTFDVKSSKKFLALLDCLPIKDVHKRILTYERKLYF